MASLNSQQAGRDAANKLNNAYAVYANENGDGFSNPDWRGAYDYREEGYRLGEEAFRLYAEEIDDHIENAVEAFPESARYLVAVAAAFRLAELEAHAVFAAPAERVAA